MKVPSQFLESLSASYGSDTAERLVTAIETEPSPISVRPNPLKNIPSLLPSSWTANPVPWSYGLGYYLPERPSFTFDPLFHAGCYYVQEASSMFLAHALHTVLPSLLESSTQPLRALDLCAAPGGKSTLLRSLLPPDAFLLSNEPLKPRAATLKENISKWGHPLTAVSSGYATDIASTGCRFNLILADVPCSGEGMMRKEPEAISQWSKQLTLDCARLQRSIISDIWPSLLPGGYLIYSTCTYNTHENEENIRTLSELLGAEYVELAPPADWHIYISTPCAGYHFLPHLTRGEGFYLAVLRKPMLSNDSYTPSTSERKTKRGKNKKQKEVKFPHQEASSLVSSWLSDSHLWSDTAGAWTLVYRETSEEYVALPTNHADFINQLRQGGLQILTEGVPIARPKGRGLQPHPALALSAALRPDAFACADLPITDALAYLRAESLILPPETPRGHVLITYRNIPLGFANNLGSRANNLYPSNWRIRTTHLPTENESQL